MYAAEDLDFNLGYNFGFFKFNFNDHMMFVFLAQNNYHHQPLITGPYVFLSLCILATGRIVVGLSKIRFYQMTI